MQQTQPAEQLNLDWSLESETEPLEEEELDLIMHKDEASLPLSSTGERHSTLCGPYGSCSPKKRRWYGILSLLAIIVIVVVAVTSTRNKSDDNNIINNEVWTQIRLNRDILPNQYFLNYNINLTTFDFTGTERVEISIQNPTNTIIIHSRYLNVSDVQVWTSSNTRLTVTNHFFYVPNDFLIIETSETLQAQQTYYLQLSFHGWLRDELAGLYRSSYITSTGEKRYIATTQFESTDARAAFPCFDEPAFKANFSITITCEPQYHALSNMPIKNQTTTTTSKTFVFDTSVKMSTYLVAMVVSDFVSVTQNTTSSRYPSKQVSIWTHQDQINQTLLALNASTKILSHYEDLYGYEFPLPKQDFIAIPDYSGGAMENWGLITFEELSLLYDETESSQSNQQRVVTVVAHELAHQWFGDLVTMNWWNELWLNEGFAQYVEYDGANHTNPEWDMFDQFITIAQRSALTLDATHATHPVLQPVERPADISQMFDSISYDKGASLIRMMVGFLGKQAFTEGLQLYIQSHAFGNADSINLWASMSAYAPNYMDVGSIMNTWTKQPGYPVLRVSEVANGLQISQQRFFSSQGTSDTKWHVYVTSRVPSNNTIQTAWLKPTDASITIRYNSTIDPFIKLDVDETNFYRVNYTATLWSSLTQALQQQDQTLSIADRAGLVDDAFALAEAGIVSYPTALNLSKFLSNEPSYVVWEMASDILLALGHRLETTRYYGVWQNYMHILLKPQYDQIQWNTTAGTPLDTLKRSVILNLACEYAVSTCRSNAMYYFKQFYEQNTTIDANIRDLVYRVAIADDITATYFEWLYTRYDETNVASESDRILKALAQSRDVYQLNGLLQDSLSSRIRSQDTMSLIERIASNPIGTPLAWDFIRDNWSTLADKFNQDIAFGDLIKGVTARFDTIRKSDEVSTFLSSVSFTLGTASKSAPQALEAIQANILWLKTNLDSVANWLQYI